jgi:nitrite reductase/ring-hydroxylating ferredoxin subunit
MKKKDLEEGKLLKVDIHDKSLALTSIKGNYYAMDSVCSHQGGPLEEVRQSANDCRQL